MCGLLNPCLNFALASDAAIENQAIARGAAPIYAADVVWVIVANVGFIPNLAYCVYVLKSRSTWKAFRQGTPSYWVVTPAMGLMWICGTVLYGIGATLTGALAS
jgi:hypothetical protein